MKDRETQGHKTETMSRKKLKHPVWPRGTAQERGKLSDQGIWLLVHLKIFINPAIKYMLNMTELISIFHILIGKLKFVH